jgi:predicted sugar kinase
MLLELVSPAILPLGLVLVGPPEHRQPGVLGVTLQHPTTQALVYAGQFQVTGARAHIGRHYGQAFCQQAHLLAKGTVELELAIPSQMGLGSEAMIGLTMARALNWVHALPLDSDPTWPQKLGLARGEVLALPAFERGGLLVAGLEMSGSESSEVLRRIEIAHEKRNQDWVCTLFLPRLSSNSLEDLERRRLANLPAALDHIPAGRLAAATEALLSAVDTDNLDAFAAALMEIQAINQEGCARAGNPDPSWVEEQRVWAVMRESGALAWGRSAAGQALFGLVPGGPASVQVCAALRHELGFDKGMSLATIVDNQGSRYKVHPVDVDEAKHLIFNAHQGLLSGGGVGAQRDQ